MSKQAPFKWQKYKLSSQMDSRAFVKIITLLKKKKLLSYITRDLTLELFMKLKFPSCITRIF